MNTTPKHGLTNRLIAMLLVLTMTCVYVVGDNYAPIIAEQSKPKSTDLLAQTLSYSTGLSPDTELRDVSDLVLAENTTNMGKASQSLSEAFAKMPENVKSSDELDKIVADFSKQIAELKAQTIDELSETDNGSMEFSEYRDTVISGFNEVEKLLSTVSVENYKMVMSEISTLINPEKPYVSLADDLPFNDVSDDNITYSTYNPESVTDYQIDDGSYSNDDLRQTNDTIINDDVRAEFADLESVLEVYQYIKNNYMMEFYFGSRKGAVGASAEKAGNDYDIASLLIGVLRDRNIPARYAKGEIEITAEQAMEWTATDDINVAIRSIVALGIPTTGMISDGETVAVRLEHTWVEAYVPYTDYRGTGNRSGERLWIPLDASFKKSTHLDGADIETINAYMKDESNYLNENSVINGVSVSNIAKMVDGEESAFVKYMLENGYDSVAQVFGGKEIIYEDLGYLPLSLPYNTVSDTERYDDIPIDYTDTINFELFGNSASGNNIYGDDFINETIFAPDVYGKRLTLTYVPATQADSEVISEHGGIFSTPAYLVKMKPQFVIDGEVIAEGGVCNTGYTQKYIITLSNKASSQNNSEITNNVIVGGMYSIVLDYGNVSEIELKNAKAIIDDFSTIVSEYNCYTEQYMGEILYSIGKLYFSQLDIYNEIAAGVHNVTSTRSLSLGIIGFKADVTYTFGAPSEITEGGLFLDIGHDVHSVVSSDNNNESEKKFMLETGMYASAMEHGILEQVTGVESVSTIKALQYAQQNNVPIHYITKDTLDSEVAQLTFSDQLISEIRSSVNSGKVIIIPEHDLTINQWTGVGYMVLDPDTFACGYMISGGMAGGAMSWKEFAWELFKQTVEGIAVGLAVMFFAWLFPELIPLFIIAGIFGYAYLLYSISTRMYDGVIHDNTLEIQEAVIDGTSFILSSLFFLGLYEATKPETHSPIEEGGTEGKTPLEEANEEAGKAKGGACFIAGTLVATSSGYTQIECIKAGDIVKSFDPSTLKVSNQVVEETFVRQINELIKISVNSEIITTTPDHPFYVAKKGFVNAIELKAGDLLITVNGEYAVITMIQHEILESPVDVFNFSVNTNHTYFVGQNSVGVHNVTPGCQNNGYTSSYLKMDPTKSNKLALGFQDRLFEFADEHNAYTFKDFWDPDAGWKAGVQQAIYDPDMEIIVNLDGIDNPIAAAQRGIGGAGGATDWELGQIWQSKTEWGKITWYKDGEIVPNPFLRD